MKLIANGCSWTYGGGLDKTGIIRPDLDQFTWPKHLHDLLDATEFANLAEGCGSNQRIVRTTLDYLLNNDTNDTIAIIQLTEESRFEYYYPLDINDQYENISDRWMRVKVKNLTPEIIDRFDKHYSLSQERLIYHTSDIQNIYTYIEHCEALSNLFNKFNIKYYFWDFTDIPTRMPEPFKTYVLNSYPWLQYIDGKWNYWEYDRIDEEDLHPSINGNKQLAEMIYNIVKEDLK